MKKRILLTGYAGFIGWKVASQLLEAGHDVLGIDNFNDYYDVRLKRWRSEQLAQKNFRSIEGDIEDRELIFKVFEENGFDLVINLAARAGVRASLEDPFIYVQTNCLGLVNILEAMKRFSVKKIVLASTSSLYAGQQMPFSESLEVSRPISQYAASKKAAEVMAHTYHHLNGFDVSIVRYFTAYGPAGRPDMSPLRFMRAIELGEPLRLFGDGAQTRDFTYIDDIASGTIAAIKPVGYEIINLGGGMEPISINFMIEVFESLLGKKAIIEHLPFNCSDMMHTSANIEKAKALLGWEPKVSALDGFGKLVKWYKENYRFVNSLTF